MKKSLSVEEDPHQSTSYEEIETIAIKAHKARQISWNNFGKRILFYVPSFLLYKNKHFQSTASKFPSISVTGKICTLQCAHCGGKILDTMIPALTPAKLFETCSDLKKRGAVGCLVSGGCLSNGSVPLENFISTIAEIKRRLGLTIVVHTGLINEKTARKLKEAEVDAVSVDILGSNETIKEIYHLDASTIDYEKTLRTLEENGLPFTPHVLIGLHHGELKGEIAALKMIATHKPSALILIIFFPIRGTKMERVKPPSLDSISEILIQARYMMPSVPIALGCARPKDTYRKEIDVLAVETGVNAIAFPSQSAIKRAETLGLEISYSNMCCSQAHEDIKKRMFCDFR